MDALFDLFSGFFGGRVSSWFEPAGGFSAKAAARRIDHFADRKRVKIPIHMTSHPDAAGKSRRTTFEVAIDGGKSPRKITKGWWDEREYGRFETIVASGAVTPNEGQGLGRVVLGLAPLGTGRPRDLEFIETDWSMVQAAAREAL